MRFAAIALVLFISPVLPGEGFALGRDQTDWYSRGIVRQQTINGMTARKKQEQHRKRKKRKTQSRIATGAKHKP